MPELNEQPTLADYQRFVAELEVERGFSDQTILDKCLLMGEEVGEVFKAVRTQQGLAVDVPGGDVGEELVDVFIYLCTIANRLGIDFEAAFRSKEEKNRKRTWT